MSKACKTPLGWLVKGRGRSEDLIKTPTEMAELYANSLKHDRDVSHERENNDYNLSTVLSNVSFLYGNDESLVDIYDGLVMSMTESTGGDAKLNPREASAVGCLRKALEEFQFSLNSSQIGLISSIKKKLYRVIDLLLVNLGKLQYPGVVENSPWNVLQRLNKDGQISSEAFHNLMVVTGVVNEVRLMAYLRSGKQDELFSFFDQSMDIDFELTKNFFLRFFYTVLPFQRAVKNFLSHFLENSAAGAIQFPPEEHFYEYTPLTSAVAISLTSYRFFDEVMAKFEEAIHSVEDESSRRLCLAYLSCLHPDYSLQPLTQLLEHTPSSGGDEESSDWRIFSFLVASLASFHQDDVENVERFLAHATTESSRLPRLDTSNPGELSRSQVVVQSYEILVRGLLKLRRKRYEEALREFETARATYESNTRVEKGKCSLFVIFCIFMSGRCNVQLGHYEDSSMETAMRLGKIYTGNQEYMRILYHAYVGMVSLQREQDEVTIKHCEKIVELFLRFRCPIGQELWASIQAQSVILVALFLGLHYREMGRVDDALCIFQVGSTRLISKALEFCEEKNHVGTKSVETARMYVDAFKAVFNLLEAECLHEKGNFQEMWTKLGEAVAKLAKYRGTIEPIELREVFQSTATRGGSLQGAEGSHVWRLNLDSSPLAPRVVDTFTLAPLLEAWSDKITMVMQYILYTIERDVHGQLIEKGTPIIMLLAMLSSNPGVFEKFQSNPFEVVQMFIPMLRQNPAAGQMLSGIFASANAQRTTMLGLIKTDVAEIDRYAVEFIDGFIELFLLYLRLSLCHDLVNSFGLFK